MQKNYVSPEEGQELKTLWKIYHTATTEALYALGTPPHAPLEGEKLARFITADTKAGEAIKRIKEIMGE